jgi:hypothetical protein
MMSPRLRKRLLLPLERELFITVSGWNEERYNEGYIPDRSPVIRAINTNPIPILKSPNKSSFNCFPEMELKVGRRKETRTIAIIIPQKAIKVDSLKN